MPTVTHGLYGEPIDPETVTIEHIKPRSKGGESALSNYALANGVTNAKRGNKPLGAFLTEEMLKGYLKQFNFEVPGKFNGYQYQEMVRRACAEEGVGTITKEIVASSGDSFVKQVPKQIKHTGIDYGNIRSIIANIDKVDLGRLSKKMFKRLLQRKIIP
jgi:hypothetical protein